MPADPRFKNDPEFLQNHVCPSLLNRLLAALSALMVDGVDYKPLQGAIQEAKEASCHLIRWASDVKLETGKGRIKLSDLFESLQNWYVEQGILEVKININGDKKIEWLDEGSRFDPWIKASRLMKQAVQKIMPKARFSERTMHGFFVLNVLSPYFEIYPDFASFASSEEKNQDTEAVSTHEAKHEANNFASFASSEQPMKQNQSHEANYLLHEANKPDNHAIYEANEANEANLTFKNKTVEILPIEIGDRVIVKAGGLSGRCGTVKDISGKIANVTSPTFGMEQKIPLAHLERVA